MQILENLLSLLVNRLKDMEQSRTQKEKHPTVASRTQYQVVHVIQWVQCSLHTVARSKSVRFRDCECECAE